MVLLTMAIAALLGGGIKNVIIALSIGMIPSYVRMMCGMVMQGKEHDYVLALRSVGASHRRILFTHVFPNTLPAFIVLMTMQLGAVILAEAGLSFLGIGIAPPTPAWGSIDQRRPAVLDEQSSPVSRSGPGAHDPRLLLQHGRRRPERRARPEAERVNLATGERLPNGKRRLR